MSILFEYYLAKCAVMYWIGQEPFLKSQIRKSPKKWLKNSWKHISHKKIFENQIDYEPSWAVARRLPDTRLNPTWVAPASVFWKIIQ